MKINGIVFISINHTQDVRGKSYQIFEKESIEGFSSSEIFVSISNKNVIRGMHFQPYPYGQKKIVTVLEGRIEGVILDLRKNSDTYLKIDHVELDEESQYSLMIPEYCAWGFRAMEDRNMIVYNISGEYHREAEMGIRWDSIEYDWKTKHPIINERDKNLMTLNEYIRR